MSERTNFIDGFNKPARLDPVCGVPIAALHNAQQKVIEARWAVTKLIHAHAEIEYEKTRGDLGKIKAKSPFVKSEDKLQAIYDGLTVWIKIHCSERGENV